MSTHTFGPVTVDTASLPQASIDALVRRGLSHFFGNEVASKVTGRKQRHLEDKEKNPEATPLTDDEVTAIRNEYIQNGFKALMEGTIGQHTPRAAVDPLEAEMRKEAAQRVRLTLSNAGIKAPKKDETVTLKGQEFTMDQLIDRQIAKNEADITKVAKAAIKARAARKASVEAGAKKVDEAESVDDLGL